MIVIDALGCYIRVIASILNSFCCAEKMEHYATDVDLEEETQCKCAMENTVVCAYEFPFYSCSLERALLEVAKALVNDQHYRVFCVENSHSTMCSTSLSDRKTLMQGEKASYPTEEGGCM